MLLIEDKIYGKFKITEPVLVELINSKPVQRLKEINQHGHHEKWTVKPTFSRYEHSVGVMLLLRKLGASLTEQVAGLLHDVSHTVFSHVTDWFLGDPLKEDYADKIHKAFIEDSEIPSILQKYNLNVEEITDYKKHTLLERQAPDLCADRLDYTFREMKSWADQKNVEKCIKDLKVKEKKIIFKEKEAAEAFAKAYAKCQEENWTSTRGCLNYLILGEVLKEAIKEKIIEKSDLYKTDKEVLKKLKESKNKNIQKKIKSLEEGIEYRENKKDPQYHIKKKFRYVDPEYVEIDQLRRVSEKNKEFKIILEKQRERSKEGIKVDIV